MALTKNLAKQKLKEKKQKSFIAGIPITVWLFIIVLVPVFLMFVMSFRQKSGYEILNVFTISNYLEFFRNDTFWRLLLKSFRMAFMVSISAIITGYPLAYFVSRRLRRFRNLFYMLIITPLWVSYLVRIIAWRTILGNRGLINTALLNLGIIKEPLSIFLYNQASVVLTLTYIAIPFVFIPLYTALEKIPNNLIDAARDLGASEARTFINVIFPLSLPGLVTGFMLSFIIALGDYIIPAQLGGNAGIMYGNVVWAQFGGAFNWPFGAALGFILFFIAAVVLVIAQIFGSKEGIFAE
ncbi:MAG: ABC transporter permease [Actinobacteria bacterium]|nr:ABC transporter permease [Actinomycetota bacterium]